MDFMSAAQAINRSPERVHARIARRLHRTETTYSHIAGIVQGTRNAQLSWSLEKRDPEHDAGFPIGTQHPGQAAIMAVRNALAEYHVPVEFKTRYTGMHRLSGRGGHQIHEGTIDVELSFRSLSGVDRVVEIPVSVRNGHVIEPGVLIDRGTYRTITQSTLDDLIRQGTFDVELQNRRTMYSPPPEDRRAPRIVPLLRPGMFGVSPVNKQLTAAYVRSAVLGQYVADLPSFQAMRDEADDHIDRAEQPLAPLMAGDWTTLKHGVDLAGRDGNSWHLTGGTECQVQRDMEGDGRYYYVYFPEVNLYARLNAESLA